MRGFFALVLACFLVGCAADKFAGSDGGGPEGGIAPSVAGCSDGTREAFSDAMRFTAIAACSGGFAVAGTASGGSAMPQCNRNAGNTSSNPNGAGCSIEDLCAAGWHVCRSQSDVAMSLPMGTNTCATSDATAVGFWLTRQTTNATYQCSGTMGSQNNVVGCSAGNMGRMADPQTCLPLTHTMSFVECNLLPPWQCDAMQPAAEALTISKSGPAAGGVTCCLGN